jgi:hypothetical protein
MRRSNQLPLKLTNGAGRINSGLNRWTGGPGLAGVLAALDSRQSGVRIARGLVERFREEYRINRGVRAAFGVACGLLVCG